jgi:acyl carrier protein
MTRAQIQASVTNIIAEITETDPGQITADDRLIEDLGLDSIDAIDMAARLDEITGERLSERQLLKIKSVRDIVDVVAEIFARKGIESA